VESERYHVNPAKVVHETIEGEAILIHLESGFYYSLDGAGADVWGLLAESRPVGDVAVEVADRYEADPEAVDGEVRRLAAELAEEGLLEPAPNGLPPAARNGTNGGPPKVAFTPPVLSKYEDMQDFLLVDPIHETGDAGWPNPPARG
jgi:hypothetical protein